jgi:pimeloyl-ACP methyl ester carboxylesterase
MLNQLTLLARVGKLSGSFATYQSLTMPKFTKVVAIGHSAGSIVTSGLLTRHPGAVDGAVLTGFLLSSQLSSDNPDSHGLGFARSSKRRTLQ